MSNDPTWGNPEGFCPEGHYTTDINSHGECREHELPVQEDRDDVRE